MRTSRSACSSSGSGSGNGTRPSRPMIEVHQDQPRDGAERRDPEALDQQLLRQPPAAGAERHADGDFPASDRRPREQQAGDVRAGNRENQPDRHEQHREEGSDGGHAAELFGRADRREQRDLPELALTGNGDGLARRHERRPPRCQRLVVAQTPDELNRRDGAGAVEVRHQVRPTGR